MANSQQPQSLNLERLINPTERQLEFLQAVADHDYVLYGGAAGGGKSYILRWWLVWYLYQLFKFKGLRNVTVGLFCEDYPSLLDRQISKMKFEFPAELGRLKQGATTEFELRDNLGGGKIALRNLSDPSKYQSAEFAAIAVDELTKNELSMFNFLRMRMRWPGVERPKFAAGSNPGDIGGDWVKDYWIERKYPPELAPMADQFAFVQAKSSDNPHLTEAYHEWLQTQPEDLRKRFADGDWSVFQGQYFTKFELDLTYLEHDLFLKMWGPQHWQPIWISLDWGSTHHASAHWHTFITLKLDEEQWVQAPPAFTREERQAVIRASLQAAPQEVPTIHIPVTFREYVTSGLGEEAWAEEVARRTPISERQRTEYIFLSPDTGFESELHRGYRIGEVFLKRGMPRAQSAFNDRIDGWRLMHDKLRAHYKSGGLLYAGWQVTAEYVPSTSSFSETTGCPLLLKAIPWAKCDERPGHDGDVSPEGSSKLLDVLDSARYGIASYEHAKDKPAMERKREVMSKLPIEGNQRFMADKLFDIGQRKKDEPVYLGGLRSRPGKRHGRS